MMQYQYVMVEMGAEDSKSYFDNSDVRVTFLAFVVQIIVYPALLVCIDRCKHSSRGLAASDSIPESDAVTDIDVLAEHEAAKAGVAAASCRPFSFVYSSRCSRGLSSGLRDQKAIS